MVLQGWSRVLQSAKAQFRIRCDSQTILVAIDRTRRNNSETIISGSHSSCLYIASGQVVDETGLARAMVANEKHEWKDGLSIGFGSERPSNLMTLWLRKMREDIAYNTYPFVEIHDRRV